MMNNKTKQMTETAVMTAVLCILGPLTIPIGPVPVSLAPLAILLSVYILGTFKGTMSVILYLLVGAFGLPVFSGFQGGFAKIAGPTGGFLLGYIFLALTAGIFIEKFYDRLIPQFLGMCLGLAALYFFGTVWLVCGAGMGFMEALMVGVVPFVLIDLVKMAFAVFLGRAVNSRLDKAGMNMRKKSS